MKHENWEQLADDITSANSFYSNGAAEWAIDSMISQALEQEERQLEISNLIERLKQIAPDIQMTFNGQSI
jgi:hypothetical protein